MFQPLQEGPRKIAVLGNHTPRQCGIATFTADLVNAFQGEVGPENVFAIAMDDRAESYEYPPVVAHTIDSVDPDAYERAATFVNHSGASVLSLQHEYGIFGGERGGFILDFLRALEIPVVTTLHTILERPDPIQRAVLGEVLRLSDRVVAMSRLGTRFLTDIHGVDPEKIDLIPHGIPALPGETSEISRASLGLCGKSVVLTFGLLSPDKGIENVISALPTILTWFPDVVYLVVGATHPHILASQGERYRESLQALATRLGVAKNVRFVNEFVSLPALTQLLNAADIYVTPYKNAQQITSGTLAYAVGFGKAVISTPYHYAEELLADDRGILVPVESPEAIAREIVQLLSNPTKCRGFQERAAAFGESMLWPRVAARHNESLERAIVERTERQTRTTRRTRPADPALPSVNLAHLLRLTDDTGLIQHATFTVPNRMEGYCVDDNARALLLAVSLQSDETLDPSLLYNLATRYLSFVQHALNPNSGRFRNFLGFDRRWLETRGSEDSHGRTLWALGVVAGTCRDAGRRALAAELFDTALPAVESFTSPRAWAYSLIGMHARRDESAGAIEARRALSNRLLALFQDNAVRGWPWLETPVTYANARLPQALLLSGHALGHSQMVETALKSLSWLAAIQRAPDGSFSPVGSDGFLARGSDMARFDQQPIEACGMVSASLDAYAITKETRWLREADRAMAWFLGRNTLGVPVFDRVSGGCGDGLHPDRRNENQGAESTLSFLQALHDMRTQFPERKRVIESPIFSTAPAKRLQGATEKV